LKRRVLSAAVRTAVGLAVLAFLISRTGITELRDAFRATSAAYLTAAFALILVGVIVSAVRWSLFLRALGYVRPVWYLTRLYAVGFFFNAFLPTGIGGDVFKAVRVRRPGDPMGPAFASVALDRLSGMVGLALIGAVAGAVRLAGGDRTGVVAAGFGLSVLVLAGTAVFVVAPPRKLVARVTRHRRLQSVRQGLEAFDIAARTRSAAIAGVAWSVVYQVITVAFHFALLRGLHVSIPIGALVCAVVVVTFVAFVPLTINGLGLREAAYVWALGFYAVASRTGLALGLLVLGELLAAAALGGVIYLAGGAAVLPGAATEPPPPAR
jgi:uncharacterized protein (TIRG00374 family)